MRLELIMYEYYICIDSCMVRVFYSTKVRLVEY